MTYQNKILQCMDCGYDFEFTISEQEFYASKGLTNNPKRCKPCRIERKNTNNYSNQKNNAERKMHDVICADCGGTGQVPFKPSGIKPILCKSCYLKSKKLA